MTPLSRLVRLVLPAAALALVALLPSPARAAGDGRLRLDILVDGRTLDEHFARGKTYVEATRGREYSVRITNLEPVRVAVAVSVDGRNVIDAKRTSAVDARKWVLEPWQSIVLDGWQVSGAVARRFFFTTEERSYAAWLGDVSNAGVIEAVAFREQQAVVMSEPSWWGPGRRSGGKDERAEERADADGWGGPGNSGMDRERAQPGRPSSAPPSLGASSGSAQGPRAESKSSAERQAPAEPASDAAATGIGRDVDHETRTVHFEHERTPSGSARVRYGFREELVQLGVLPEHRAADPWRRERARGFSGWCPSP